MKSSVLVTLVTSSMLSLLTCSVKVTSTQEQHTEQYFTNATTPLSNGLVGEEAESVTAYNTAINEMKRAITNQLYYKDLTVTEGESQWGDGNGTVARNSSLHVLTFRTH